MAEQVLVGEVLLFQEVEVEVVVGWELEGGGLHGGGVGGGIRRGGGEAAHLRGGGLRLPVAHTLLHVQVHGHLQHNS